MPVRFQNSCSQHGCCSSPVVTYAAPTPMIEHIAPDPAVTELVPPGDDGEFCWFKQACLPQKLVLEKLLPPFPAPVLPDAATADGCGSDKTLPLRSCPTGYDSNTDSELWEWVQVEKDEEKEEGEGAASCGAGAEETEVCGAVRRLQQHGERDHFSAAFLGAGRGGHSFPEPSIIKFPFRLHGHLWLGAGITLVLCSVVATTVRGPEWWAGQGRHVPRWSGHGGGRLADHRPKSP